MSKNDSLEQDNNKWSEDRFTSENEDFGLLDDDEIGEEELQAQEKPMPLSEDEMSAEVERLRIMLETEKAKYLRFQADTQNQQRHQANRLRDASKQALERFVNDLLPIIDSLERGIESCESELLQVAKEGMSLTLKMFIDTLAKFDVVVIAPLHERFDPSCQEAIATEQDASHPANTVLKIVQKGYKIGDKVLRPAMVIVSQT